MAKENESKISPVLAGSLTQQKVKKKNSFLFGLIILLISLVVIAGVIVGVFWIIIRSNANGFADKYRNQINGMPVLRHALPAPPEDYDPLAPENMGSKELVAKYKEFRRKNAQLSSELENTKKELDEFKKIQVGVEEIMAENEKLKKDMEAESTRLEEEISKMQEVLAKGDKEGFREFFEKMDKNTAQSLYANILEEQKADEQAKQFAQIYEKMDAGAAAAIFEELGSSQIELVAKVLKSMKKDAAAQIIAEMDEKFAAQVTDILSKKYGLKGGESDD
ncbi:MAG: DUF615 domain-containing protein [Clostridium sp.]|jgi:flagellar motility protein MotE (MotC chaperone)|nr:DUF615 domain-containing protein [Clostridium sp.]